MGQLLDGSWVTKCDPLSALHRVANETSLNHMADGVDDEQYAKFANSVKQLLVLRVKNFKICMYAVMTNMMWTVETGDTGFNTTIHLVEQ